MYSPRSVCSFYTDCLKINEHTNNGPMGAVEKHLPDGLQGYWPFLFESSGKFSVRSISLLVSPFNTRWSSMVCD